jgi:predicted Zn-ribbon and HTH transcriptional regulator
MALVTDVKPEAKTIDPVEARLRGLRKSMELARMAHSKALREQRATPKDAPGYAHAQYQTRMAKSAHEAAKTAYAQAETMAIVLRDSARAVSENRVAKVIESAKRDGESWAAECRRAREPFEFVVNRKGGRLIMTKGTVRAACGLVCMNEQSKVDHEAGCPKCQSKNEARKHRERIILEI